MKAVLDTNVLISATVTKGTCHEVLWKGFLDDYRILLSPDTIQEYRNTLLDRPEKFKLTDEEIRKRVGMLEFFGTFVTVETNINEIEEDPTDNMFLELAVDGGADYIVSGDPHLSNLESYHEIEIVDPSEFLKILNSKR